MLSTVPSERGLYLLGHAKEGTEKKGWEGGAAAASRKWSSPQPASDRDADHLLASLYQHSSIPLLHG